MRRRIAGSTAVVTGASSGIGRATAIALARRGADVVLAARSESSLNEVAERCEEVGGRALVVPTDVSDEDAVGELARRAGERFGRIDTWVNGAAVIAYGELEEIPSDVYRQVVETNLFGQLHGARAALPWFRDRGEGVLINVASVWGQVSSPFVSPYVVSKFGVRALTECLQQALAADPATRAIRACLILPVSVDTPIFRHAANYLGREVKPVPPVLAPDRVVESILATIERPRSRVVVGWSGRPVAALHAAAPRLFTAVIPHAMRRMALGREPASGGPGNVFESMPSWNRVRGGWIGERRRAHRGTIGGAVAVALLAAAAGFGRARRPRRS